MSNGQMNVVSMLAPTQMSAPETVGQLVTQQGETEQSNSAFAGMLTGMQSLAQTQAPADFGQSDQPQIRVGTDQATGETGAENLVAKLLALLDVSPLSTTSLTGTEPSVAQEEGVEKSTDTHIAGNESSEITAQMALVAYAQIGRMPEVNIPTQAVVDTHQNGAAAVAEQPAAISAVTVLRKPEMVDASQILTGKAVGQPVVIPVTAEPVRPVAEQPLLVQLEERLQVLIQQQEAPQVEMVVQTTAVPSALNRDGEGEVKAEQTVRTHEAEKMTLPVDLAAPTAGLVSEKQTSLRSVPSVQRSSEGEAVLTVVQSMQAVTTVPAATQLDVNKSTQSVDTELSETPTTFRQSQLPESGVHAAQAVSTTRGSLSINDMPVLVTGQKDNRLSSIIQTIPLAAPVLNTQNIVLDVALPQLPQNTQSKNIQSQSTQTVTGTENAPVVSVTAHFSSTDQKESGRTPDGVVISHAKDSSTDQKILSRDIAKSTESADVEVNTVKSSTGIHTQVAQPNMHIATTSAKTELVVDGTASRSQNAEVKEMTTATQRSVTLGETPLNSEGSLNRDGNQSGSNQWAERQGTSALQNETHKTVRQAADSAAGTATDAARLFNAEQVVTQTKERLAQHEIKPGNQQITLTLSPDSLGELKMNLNLQGQKLSVEIVTENRMVRDAIVQHTDALKESLARQNITMESFDVTTGGKGSAGHGQNQNAWRELVKQQQQQQFWGSPRGYATAQVDVPAGHAAYLQQQGRSMLDIHY
jgi:flagellar hook-length control protein FliK